MPRGSNVQRVRSFPDAGRLSDFRRGSGNCEAEAGRRRFTEEASLIGWGNRDDFFEDAAANVVDSPASKLGVNLVAATAREVERTKSSKPCGAKPGDRCLGLDGYFNIQIAEFLPSCDDGFGREDLFCARME